MVCEGKCINCQQIRNLNISKRLCEHCLQNTRVPFKRKRYESEISAKSGISALSAETQLTDIEDDDLECDGPSSDIDNDVTREQTDPKTIEFDLQSVGSLASHRYVYPIESAGQPLPRTCTSRTSLSSMSKTPNSRQIAQAQTKRRRQMRKNYSESDTGGFKQRPYIDRRYSADDENQIEELVPRDSIVLLNENFDNQPKVYVARAIKAVKSDPNVHRINPNAENLRINPNAESLYDSVNDDDSGYMQHQFVRRQSRQAVQEDRVGALNKDEELGKQTCCDNCLQRPARLKWTLAIVVFIAWAPVIVLTALLLGSVHGDPPPTEQPPIIGDQHRNIMEDIINREVDKKIHGVAARSNAAPLRLEGDGLIKHNVSDNNGNFHSHHRFKWSVPSHFVQNPISLMPPDQVLVRVNMTGYYVVFCRIYYIGNQHAKEPFTVQHSLYKVNQSPNDERLDSVSQHCMFMNDSHIEHTSTLQTLVYLEAGSEVYIRVRGTDFIDRRSGYSKNVMGMFILPRVN